MEKNSAREEIRILLERYAQIMKGEKEIKSKGEEMTKKDLIRPLFERVLGWNFEEDVMAEEKISKGWVDYGFRINRIPKFFLEAKALKEDLDNQKFFEQNPTFLDPRVKATRALFFSGLSVCSIPPILICLKSLSFSLKYTFRRASSSGRRTQRLKHWIRLKVMLGKGR